MNTVPCLVDARSFLSGVNSVVHLLEGAVGRGVPVCIPVGAGVRISASIGAPRSVVVGRWGRFLVYHFKDDA